MSRMANTTNSVRVNVPPCTPPQPKQVEDMYPMAATPMVLSHFDTVDECDG